MLTILQGLLTPVIGLTALYIAWQQWKTNEFKLKLERYERRLRIYQEIVAILAQVQQQFKPEIGDLQKFLSATAEADFLFGPEIAEYRDEIFKRAVALWTANFEYRDFTQPVPPGYDHNRVVGEMTEQHDWFVGQFAAAKQKFQKYPNVNR